MLLTDRLAQATSLALRHGKKVALMYLDLDHFKHINDSLGHEVGDKLLRSAAKRLQACVRLSDTVSRQGGDEFLVLLAEVEEVNGAVVIAKKLIEAMTEPHIIGDHRLHINDGNVLVLDAVQQEDVCKMRTSKYPRRKSVSPYDWESYVAKIDDESVAINKKTGGV